METGCRYNQTGLEEVVVRVFSDPTIKKQMADKSREYQEWSIGNSKGGQPRGKWSLGRTKDVLPSKMALCEWLESKQQKENTYDQ